MLKSFFGSRQWALWAWGGAFLLFLSIVLEVWVNVWINGWYREMWDFLQNPHSAIKASIDNKETDWLAQIEIEDEEASSLKELAESKINRFWSLVAEFCYIVFPFIFLRAFSSFLAQHYAFRWRQAITFSYFSYWMETQGKIEGASQRLQEDPQKFARLVEQLGLGFFRAVLTLIAFIPILWNISKEISERFQAALALETFPISLPFFSWTANTVGSLMWVAIFLAVGGTIISYFVGIRLPGLEYNNQVVEAAFRKKLVYGEDDRSHATFPSLTELFTGLRFNYFRLYLHYSYFSVWATTFSQFVIIADLILIGTGVVLGIISLGFLNQISHAFSKVTESLSYFTNNWTTVTELMSVTRRLKEFENHIHFSETKPINQ